MIFCDFRWLPVTSGNFRFYTYVTSGFTPTSLPVLHLRHFRFHTYVTSGFTPTSLPVSHLRHFRFHTYVTSGFTPTSLPVLHLRHFRFHTYVTSFIQIPSPLKNRAISGPKGQKIGENGQNRKRYKISRTPQVFTTRFRVLTWKISVLTFIKNEIYVSWPLKGNNMPPKSK